MTTTATMTVEQALADAAQEMRREVELVQAHDMPGDVLVVEYRFTDTLPHDPARTLTTTRLGVWIAGERAYGVIVSSDFSGPDA